LSYPSTVTEAAYDTEIPGETLLRCPRNGAKLPAMNYQDIISIEPGKRGGRPCIRHMRIAVADVLGWLTAGQTHAQILDDFPGLTDDDIRACLACAADRERRLITAAI
jgi:uncharacterized protein (DUF433 family)